MTRTITCVCIMWAYFNSWDVVGDNDATIKKLPINFVVVTTRLLHSAEENKIVEYFHKVGPKRIPAGLPYAAGGWMRALSARATKEMESMPYRSELVAIGCIVFSNDVVHTRYMYVKRMRLTGFKQLDEIGRCAYRKVGDTDDNHTEQDSETDVDMHMNAVDLRTNAVDLHMNAVNRRMNAMELPSPKPETTIETTCLYQGYGQWKTQS